MQMSCTNSLDDFTGERLLLKEDEVPRTRLRRMLSKFALIPRRRKMRGHEVHEVHKVHAVLEDSAHPTGALDKESMMLHVPSAELTGAVPIPGHDPSSSNLGGKGTPCPSAHEQAHPKMNWQLPGPTPAYDPAFYPAYYPSYCPPQCPSPYPPSEAYSSREDCHPPPAVEYRMDVEPARHDHGRLEDVSSPVPVSPLGIDNGTMRFRLSPITPYLSKKRNRRFDPPSPLTILSPASFSSSIRTPSDIDSSFVPYSPNDFDSPKSVSPLPSQWGNDQSTTPAKRHSHQSLHSSASNRSSRPSCSPTSLRSNRRISYTRKTKMGTEQAECNYLLAPPTSNFPPTQRTPIDSENFVCLGPLPDNIPLPSPSPDRIRPRSRSRQPSRRRGLPEGNDDLPKARSDSMSPIKQDPLLHDVSPLRPHKSPVTPIFTTEHTLQAHQQRDEFLERTSDSCSSIDSLGSNFTVEEEARIQAQIVKNLAMLGHERVGGEGDIVHIPQPPERRFSWEEER